MNRHLQLLLPILFAICFANNLQAQNNKPGAALSIGEGFTNDISPEYLQKLIDTAKKHYPEVKIKAAQVGIAQTTYSQAKLAWLDAISISPSYVYNPASVNVLNATGGATNTFNGYQIGFSVNIGGLITKPFVAKIAKQSFAVAQLQQQEYNLTIEAQVKRLYYTYLNAQASLRLLTHAVQDAQLNVEQVKHRYEEVSTTLTEYNTSLTQFYTQNVSKLTAELAYYTAKTNLEEIVGKRLEDIR